MIFTPSVAHLHKFNAFKFVLIIVSAAYLQFIKYACDYFSLVMEILKILICLRFNHHSSSVVGTYSKKTKQNKPP